MGSARFGIFENFKKEIGLLKGSKENPAPLELADKALAAFGTGLIVSFLVVSPALSSVRSNTPESESKSREDKQTRSTVAHSTPVQKYLRIKESKGSSEAKHQPLSEKPQDSVSTSPSSKN